MITNPLRDPRDRRLPRVPEPCALVVFGITGDLARKKLLPAIYDLANRGLLPADFVLLGFARRDWEDGDFESPPDRTPNQWMVQEVTLDNVESVAQRVAEQPKEGKQCLMLKLEP